jgi:hypothetical protein
VRVQEVVVAQGLPQDATNKAEMRQVVRIDAGGGVGLVGGPVRGDGEESIVLRRGGREGGREGGRSESQGNGAPEMQVTQ